jgi:hypothetical protein
VTAPQARPRDHGVSAAHVSAVLAKAGHERASEPGDRQSGFYVKIERVEGLGRTVIVAYQYYGHEGDYSNETYERVSLIVSEAHDRYAATLRDAGYETENWLRYDEVRLGLFVTGRR